MMRHAFLFVAALAASSLVACGGDDPADTTTDAEPASDGEFSLEIVAPADGDSLDLPFTLELDVSTEIGPTDTGLHHVHLFVDGESADFEIIDALTWEVTADSDALAGVEAGERELGVTLHTSTHEPVGAQDQVSVMLSEGGQQGSGPRRDY